jgi:hypothetical protein
MMSASGAQRPKIGLLLWVDSDQRSQGGKRRVELPLTFEELTMDEAVVHTHPEPWNKGKLVGQKAPFKLKEIWAIRVRLQLFRRARDLALFELGIDSKLRACDLVRLKVRDICHGDRVAARAIVMQQKTSRPRGSRRQACARKTTSSQAASMNRST